VIDPEYIKEFFRYKALCMSPSCTYTSDDSTAVKGTEKNVPRQTIECPDCKHALFWEKVFVGSRKDRKRIMRWLEDYG
jgi:hypothetical protein